MPDFGVVSMALPYAGVEVSCEEAFDTSLVLAEVSVIILRIDTFCFN